MALYAHPVWVTKFHTVRFHVTSRRRKLLTVWWCTRPGSQGDPKLPTPTSLELAGDNDVTTHDGRAGVDSLPKELAPLLLQEEVGRAGYVTLCPRDFPGRGLTGRPRNHQNPQKTQAADGQGIKIPRSQARGSHAASFPGTTEAAIPICTFPGRPEHVVSRRVDSPGIRAQGHLTPPPRGM
ncbi:unnamed protein product [Phytophthora lilii]|uniref:Unnamed protein product n=1 Tax=Phytophthora lilii TaxID=2077276 RepID=A0A9W7CVL1_9STRA|nr:unnamed protein product [Phytophthora lilii]